MAHTAIGVAAGAGDTDLIPAPGEGLRLKLSSIFLISDGASECKLRSGAAGVFLVGNATFGVELSTLIVLNVGGPILVDENQPVTLTKASPAIGGIIIHETVKVSDIG